MGETTEVVASASDGCAKGCCPAPKKAAADHGHGHGHGHAHGHGHGASKAASSDGCAKKKQQQIMDMDMDTDMVLQKQRQRHLTVVPKDAALRQRKQQQIMDTDMDMVHKPSLLHRLPTAQRDAARKKMSRLLSQCWLSVSVVSSTSLSQLTQSSYSMEWCRHRSMETT